MQRYTGARKGDENRSAPSRPNELARPPAPGTMMANSPFEPAWWLPGAHLQTLWPALFRRRPALRLRPERLELPDGDFLDLSWVEGSQGPLILVLHGLEGNLQSHYAAGLLKALARSGLRPVFLHFRNCGPEPNRLVRSYHAGETGDLQLTLEHLRQLAGEPVAGAVGVSLGGNILLKWLGERGDRALLETAVAISVPFCLGDTAVRLERGLSRIYQAHLLTRMRASYRRKFSRMASPVSVDVDRIRSFREFDDRITAPLHGFAGVDEYYRLCSCRQFLPRIRTPTLILHALDDPFMYRETVPTASELGQAVTLELARGGGHVGFVSGPLPWKPRY